MIYVKSSYGDTGKKAQHLISVINLRFSEFGGAGTKPTIQ